MHRALRACALTLWIVPLTYGAGKTGRQLYQTNCAACHGKDGTGGVGGAANLRKPLPHGGDTKTIQTVIQNGVPDKGMPPFGSLPGDDVKKLVQYVKELNREGGK